MGNNGKLRSYQADLSLLAVSAVWGVSFTMVKQSLGNASPMLFLAIRFLIAAAVLLPWLFAAPPQGRRGRLLPGVLVGCFLFAGYAFQTLGLQRVTPTNSAFVTALSVILVPLCVIPIRRRLPAGATWFGVGLATVGLYFLLLDAGQFQFSPGDLLTLCCALMFALHIVAIDRFARREPLRHFATVQIVTAAILAAGAALFLETPVFHAGAGLLFALGFTGIFCTAGAFAVQTSMQRYTTPTRVAIVYATEPIFAAMVSYFFHGEPLGWRDFLGGGLILAGILAAELGPGIMKGKARR